MRLMRGAIATLNSGWWLLKLANTSTILREWAAVHCVAHMSLREVLLTAKVRGVACQSLSCSQVV